MIQHDVRLSLQAAGESETFFTRCWTSYNVDQDLRDWPLSWRFTMAPGRSATVAEAVRLIKLNPIARVYVDSTLIATGRIDTWEPGISRVDGSYVNVTGFGPLGPATKDEVPLGWSPRNMTIQGAVESLLAKYGIRVVGDNAANREACTRRTVRRPSPVTGETDTHTTAEGYQYQTLGGTATAEDRTQTIADDRAIRPRPSEKRADWLRRFLAHHNLLCWETADGGVYVGLPNYGQRPLGDILLLDRQIQFAWEVPEGCVIESRAPRRPGRQATHIRVTGRVGRGGETRCSATVGDQELIDLGWDARQTVVDDQLRDEATARAKAGMLMSAAKLPTLEYEATLAGHGLGRYLMACDTMVRVRDAACFLDREPMYVVRRAFDYDRKNGARVEIGCVRPWLWLPTED